ncbi:MAG: putative DCC family thiol-disulfide oxidoreductase YuxK [Ascidiaceihabitans sp.]|jgi:predicted DCC family thiol-disulfide oxidoreductase YuxK
MSEPTKVLYNADCPVCSFEINHYRKYAQKSDLAIRFDDLNSDALTAWNITEDDAARRLYVQHHDQLYSGLPAFIVLWQEMPRYRLLAGVVSLPGLHWLLCKTYDLALAPAIYRWHRLRQRRR